MLSALGERISAVFRATAPDPFVFAVLLTGATVLLVLGLTDAGVGEVVGFWSHPSQGVWRFLGFSMQMCMILVTGHALAASPPVRRGLGALSAVPKSPAQGAALVAFVAASLGVLNWGLGLVGGALIARDVGRSLEARGVRAHYPLLAAAGYVGLLVWHGGFSGTAPLKVTSETQIADVFPPGVGLAPIGLEHTILSPMNLVATGGLLVLAPLVMALLTPKDESKREPISAFVPARAEQEEKIEAKAFVPRMLEDTPIVTLVLVALLGAWALRFYFPGGGVPSGVRTLDPNTVNLTMLMLGLILHGTPARYVRAVDDAARGCAGIMLQFPLYAGIMGMMHQSGLTAQLAGALSELADARTLPIATFVSAGVVNLFIPSGGGQWAVQGPIAVEAAQNAGVPIPKMIMAVAYGDQLTNMLQPFWALPLLAITGVRARDIVGYTALLMVVAGAWLTACLLIF